MKKRGYYSPEVRERAVRLVFTQEAAHTYQWAAIRSIAVEGRLHGGDVAEVGATLRA